MENLLKMDEEKNSLIYKILRISFVYRAYQFIVIKRSTYKFIYQNIFKTNENSVVLDCGCGPAQYRKLIKSKKYIGIDFNPKHIQTAQITAIDPVYVKKENFYDSFANFIASKDQGNYVRNENEYRELVNSKLAKAETIIYKNLLRIPFYHHILNIKI